MTWINCNDCLPDDEASVIVYSPLSIDPVWLGYLDGDEGWHWVDGRYITDPVTHWQPLPDPPDNP